MANPTAVLTHPARLACVAATAQTVSLNPDQEYLVRHLSKDNAGGAATDPIFFTTDGTTTPTSSYAEGKDRFTLLSSDAQIPFGPGISTLKFISAGAPVFDLLPSAPYKGRIYPVQG